MSKQIASALRWAQQQFNEISESARLDAELLLAHCLQKPRSYLYSWPEKTLSDSCWADFQSITGQRLKPTPIAYLLQNREFYSLNFKTSPVALIPRPETELLVDTALELCSELDHPRVLELGTGTGAISIALKVNLPDIDLLTTDISIDCLQLAHENALQTGVRLNCVESDWYSNIENQPGFDLILSNPPYIAADDPYLKQGDLPAEPLLALTPGNSGLEALQQIIAKAPDYLKAGGYLVFEHGYDQAQAVDQLLSAAGFTNIRNLCDDNGLARVSLGQLPCY